MGDLVLEGSLVGRACAARGLQTFLSALRGRTPLRPCFVPHPRPAGSVEGAARELYILLLGHLIADKVALTLWSRVFCGLSALHCSQRFGMQVVLSLAVCQALSRLHFPPEAGRERRETLLPKKDSLTTRSPDLEIPRTRRRKEQEEVVGIQAK